MTMALKTRIWLLGGLGVLGVLLTGGFGVMQLSGVNQQLQLDLMDMR